jgi:hypothetical protein
LALRCKPPFGQPARGVASLETQTLLTLSQHLHVMSHYVVYLWSFTLKFVDCPKYVEYITRQFLMNGGQDDIDELAEVCPD